MISFARKIKRHFIEIIRTIRFCLFNENLLTLLIIVFFIWGSAYFYARFYRRDVSPIKWATVHLFDSGSVANTVYKAWRNDKKYDTELIFNPFKLINEIDEIISKGIKNKDYSLKDNNFLCPWLCIDKRKTVNVDAVVAVSEFFLAWLLSCGIILFTIVDKRKEYKNLRSSGLKISNLKNSRTRAVFLGWGPSVITILREIERFNNVLDEFKTNIKNDKSISNYSKITSVIIVSNNSAEKIRQCLMESLGDLYIYPIEIDIVYGEFDSAEMFKKLAIQDAGRIFVIGENEDSNDARVLALLDKINQHVEKTIGNGNASRIKCQVNIDSLDLYMRLNQDEERDQDNKFVRQYKHLDILYHNFFYDWAERIWSRFEEMPNNMPNDNGYPRLRYDVKQNQVINLAIVGFGQMGMALAIHAASIAHYGDGTKLHITVFDPKIKNILPRFCAEFPGVAKMMNWDDNGKNIKGDILEKDINTDVGFTFKDVDIYSQSFDNYLEAVKKELLTIALTFKHSNDVLSYALSLNKRTSLKNRKILLRQNYAANIFEENGLNAISPTFLKNDRTDIFLFGFKDGSGSGECIRDFLAELIFNERSKITKEKHNGNITYYSDETTPMARWELRKRIDFLLEIINSMGFKLKKNSEKKKKCQTLLSRFGISMNDKASTQKGAHLFNFYKICFLLNAYCDFLWANRIIDGRDYANIMSLDNRKENIKRLNAMITIMNNIAKYKLIKKDECE